MKKILPIIFYISLLLFSSVSADEEKAIQWYELYKQRVNTICKIHKPKQVIYQVSEYQEFDEKIKDYVLENNDFEDAKKNYKENMWNIYKCALLWEQKKSILLIKEDLLRITPLVNNGIKNKLKNRQKTIDIISKKLKCRNNSMVKDSIQKLRVLKQATYELCKYHSYLEYIKERSNTIWHIINTNKENYNISQIVWLVDRKKHEIDVEITRSYKVFHIVFQAYTEYENNYTIHALLELLREDFLVFKEKLHWSISPINQVVYKIANAMRLD